MAARAWSRRAQPWHGLGCEEGRGPRSFSPGQRSACAVQRRARVARGLSACGVQRYEPSMGTRRRLRA
eukprot:10027483-Alexandrium_andersonii.AAC.1